MSKQIIGLVDEALALSFKRLAEKKPIEKITIKEITDMAGVIRPTFYNHFQDKYELLEWIVKTELMIPCNECFVEGKLQDGVMGFFDAIRENKRFYQSCAKLSGQNSFADILKNEIKEMILSHIDEDSIGRRMWFDWLTPKRAADYFAEAITYAVIEWIKSDMSIPKEELWEVFYYLTSHSIIEMAIGAAVSDSDKPNRGPCV